MDSALMAEDYRATLHLPRTEFPMKADLVKREPETLARWDAPIWCACGAQAERLISLPVVRADLTPYYDDGLGVRVESRAHRRAVMRSKDLIENDKPVVPHGAKGTVFSFPGRPTDSVAPSGAWATKRR